MLTSHSEEEEEEEEPLSLCLLRICELAAAASMALCCASTLATACNSPWDMLEEAEDGCLCLVLLISWSTGKCLCPGGSKLFLI